MNKLTSRTKKQLLSVFKKALPIDTGNMRHNATNFVAKKHPRAIDFFSVQGTLMQLPDNEEITYYVDIKKAYYEPKVHQYYIDKKGYDFYDIAHKEMEDFLSGRLNNGNRWVRKMNIDKLERYMKKEKKIWRLQRRKERLQDSRAITRKWKFEAM